MGEQSPNIWRWAPFPGFEAAFGIPWSPTPTVRIVVPEDELRQTLYLPPSPSKGEGKGCLLCVPISFGYALASTDANAVDY